MEATINFLEFNEIGIGEKFIIIHTGHRSERERLSLQKAVYVKTAESHSDNNLSRGANAVQLTNGTPTQVSHKTPVIRIII